MPNPEKSPISATTFEGKQVSQTASGLFVTRNPTFSPDAVPGIIIPDVPGMIVHPKIESIQPQKASIHILSKDELLSFTPVPTAVESRISSGDVIRAIQYPKLFLGETMDAAGIDCDDFSKALNRVQETIATYDKTTDTTATRTISHPGYVEQAGLVTVDLITTPSFEPAVAPLLGAFSDMLRDQRSIVGFVRYAPEMPDLTEKLLPTLDFFSTNQQARFRIYELMQQVMIPPSFQEVLLQKMDTYHDLDHPLSFALTITDSDPASDWNTEQRERRQALLETLAGSNQDLFNAYGTLVKQSRGLVYHGDPLSPTPGKVGIEIEFTLQEHGRKPYYEVSDDDDHPMLYRLRGKNLGEMWPIHDEINIRPELKVKEITRSDDALSVDTAYLQSLVPLSTWLADYGSVIGSFHMHLDKKTHPYLPALGNLYDKLDPHRLHDTRSIDTAYRNPNTWEVRSISIPRAIGTIHPARIADVIGMYSAISSSPSEKPQEPKLTISTDVSLDQLIWGHIITHVKDPTARLATLMALHDPHALQYPNPLAFVHSFAKESLPAVIKTCRDELQKNQHMFSNETKSERIAFSEQVMIQTLDSFRYGHTTNIFQNTSPQDRGLIMRILGDEVLINQGHWDELIKRDATLPSYKIVPYLPSWIRARQQVLFEKHGIPYKKLPGEQKSSGAFDRDVMMQTIKEMAQKRVETVQDALKHPGIAQSTLDDAQQTRARKKVYELALNFDEAFFVFLDHYQFHIFSMYSSDEAKAGFTMPQEYAAYVKDKTAEFYEFVKLSFALDKAAGTSIQALLKGETIDFDQLFAFNEQQDFAKQMQELYDDLPTDTHQPQTPYLSQLLKRHARMKEQMMIPSYGNKRQVREDYSLALGLLIWAKQEGIDDPKLAPVQEAITTMYTYRTLPEVYNDLIEAKFLQLDIPMDDLEDADEESTDIEIFQ